MGCHFSKDSDESMTGRAKDHPRPSIALVGTQTSLGPSLPHPLIGKFEYSTMTNGIRYGVSKGLQCCLH